MDRIQPGAVVWKRVNIAPKNRFKKVENGNYVIEIAKVLTSFAVQVFFVFKAHRDRGCAEGGKTGPVDVDV